MRRRCFLATFAAAAVFGRGRVRATTVPLRIGLMPLSCPTTLLRYHQPLRSSLAAQLRRPVELFSAPDLDGHFADIRRGEFDLVVTGPHFGAWAIANGYRPILRYGATLRPVIVATPASGIRAPADLRNRVVALGGRLSVAAISGEAWMASEGLRAGNDYVPRFAPTDDTAILSVVTGEADAAVTTNTALDGTPAGVRQHVVTIDGDATMPNLFTVANAALSREEVVALRKALLAFGRSADGKAFLSRNGSRDYADITPDDLAAVEPLLDRLSGLMARDGA